MNSSNMNRRDFLKVGGMSTLALTLGTTGVFSLGGQANVLASGGNSNNPTSGFGGYGPLVKDPDGFLDLPQGFQYKIISTSGQPMVNPSGDVVPGLPDGMAAYQGPKNTTILVRNHECGTNHQWAVNGKNPWSKGAAGGTTALVVAPNHEVVDEYVTNSGNIRNCAGGPSTWGTWLTCEETREMGHGFVFEVNPHDPENEMSKTPIRDMGYFSHEACSVDPATGIWYLTEDNSPSFLYRFTPNNRSQKLGSLQEGGVLEAAALDELPNNSASHFTPGQKVGVVWKKVNPERAKEDARDLGCIQFTRLEGSWFGGGAFWFDDTNARTGNGPNRFGRVYRYFPATNTLELFFESQDTNDLRAPDNITITPWGDLWIAEDGNPNGDRIIGLTPEGNVYEFAQNVFNKSEFAGVCFAPDGKTMFVNMQSPGFTIAVWGPFARRNSARQVAMSHAAPPASFAPQISDKVVAYAEREGISPLAAAVLDRHGVTI
ncbi:alkaline phosphatase PhoX [Alkalihalobacterium alkalinitrilicum]|uniref:alkaline phosphatase PhoX n=1 Tax=Alkalihalobacterium alkalinitrilicum TaxID=427920 RepID=UPI0009953461|nr:alkaline phosphatase PhoX [Alkalihalobacterium alkalinitrilicum]